MASFAITAGLFVIMIALLRPRRANRSTNLGSVSLRWIANRTRKTVSERSDESERRKTPNAYCLPARHHPDAERLIGASLLNFFVSARRRRQLHRAERGR